MGALIFLGGEHEGDKEPNEELRRPRKLFLSGDILIQLTPVSGMLFCLTPRPRLYEPMRGGGGRGGGDREETASCLIRLLLFPLFSALTERRRTLGILVCVSPRAAESSVSPDVADVTVSVGADSGCWVRPKRGLIKHSAPLEVQHSSWDGVRVCGTSGDVLWFS